MSKTKTKRARREAKRDHQKKVAKSLKSASSAAHKSTSTPATSAKAAKAQPGKPKPKSQTTSAQTEVPSSLALPKSSPSTAADPDSAAAAQGVPSQTPNPRKRKREVPFGTYDNILLVGEGDFSFTRSLAIEHGCANVTGTSFDTDEEVRAKYPDTFPGIREELGALTPPVPLFHGIDATKVSAYKYLRPEDENGEDDGEEGGGGGGGGGRSKAQAKGKGKGKASWDTVAFMFPHTGGLSTDVNRQVRANQALLVSFFESCLEKRGSDREREESNNSGHSHSNKRDRNAKSGKKEDNEKTKKTKKKDTDKTPFLNPRTGKIIVTLFESSPYTLWNVRDLARHCGLRVIESFEFDWEDYPGYRHVRTLGQLEGGGGWKGEDRSARMYIFGVKVEEDGQKRRKRKRGGESSDSEADGED